MTIYLDNAATTKPCEAAIRAAVECMEEDFGNPSSLHMLGVNAEKRVSTARAAVASAMSVDPGSIYFTSGATESNNLAVKGVCAAYGKRKKRIVTTTVEHHSVSDTISYMEEQGFEVVRISPESDGHFDSDKIISAVNENTCLVSCMLVNNENGCILPIKRTFARIKRDFPETITHCDAVQGFMKIPFKASELYADLISVSGHKIHGVKGVGALYIKKGVRVLPQVQGGGQEKGLRSGTEAVPVIAAFGAAVGALLPDIGTALENAGKVRAYLLDRLSALDGVKINSAEDALPYITNISVIGYRSEIMLHFLESRGIYVSSGSACSKGQKSAVLREFGANDREADSALRISICRETSYDDIDALVNAIAEGQQRLMKSK